MTTEGLLVHAISRGLCVADFHEMSIGMILEYINTYDAFHNKEYSEDTTRRATEAEINAF